MNEFVNYFKIQEDYLQIKKWFIEGYFLNPYFFNCKLGKKI